MNRNYTRQQVMVIRNAMPINMVFRNEQRQFQAFT